MSRTTPTASPVEPANVALRSWSSPKRRRASTACHVTTSVWRDQDDTLKPSASAQREKSESGQRPRRSAPSGKAALTRSARFQEAWHGSRRCPRRRRSTCLRPAPCSPRRTATRLRRHRRRSSPTYDLPHRNAPSPALTVKRNPLANLIRANRAPTVAAVPQHAQALDLVLQPLLLHVKARPRLWTRRRSRPETGPVTTRSHARPPRARLCR